MPAFQFFDGLLEGQVAFAVGVENATGAGAIADLQRTRFAPEFGHESVNDFDNALPVGSSCCHLFDLRRQNKLNGPSLSRSEYANHP